MIYINILIILPDSNMDIPIRTQLAEIYGNFLADSNNIFILITKNSRLKGNYKFYQWKKMKIYEVNSKNIIYIYYLVNKINNIVKLDILQFRGPEFSSLLFYIFRNKWNIPIVIQYSEPVIEFQTHHLNQIYRKKSLKRFLLLKLTKILDIYQISFLKKCDLVLPISPWMKKYLISRGINPSKIISFPDGINPEKLDLESENQKKFEKKFNFDEKYQRIIYIGSLDKNRNLKTLICSFKIVIEEFKDVKLLIVGKGDGELELRNLVKKIHLSNDIIFTGYVPYEEVRKYIAISDIGISPIPNINMFKISSPLKLYEYMGMGLPVIANKEIFAHKNAIEKSNCGLLVKYKIEEFARAMITLLKNPKKAKFLGENGKKWVVKHRSYKQLAKDIEKEYKKQKKHYDI